MEYLDGFSWLIDPEEGLTEPRLWVRRLCIWSEPSKIIRDIRLKPGLNIVWSPDGPAPGAAPADVLTPSQPMPHGSGKTTFCRLLRYCLGEETFGTVEQQRDLRSKLLHGYVGAEVMIAGQLWAVIRYFSHHGRDVVLEGRSLEDALLEPPTPGGISKLSIAITCAILGDAPNLMPPSLGKTKAWPSTLALVTRDQECLSLDPLVWRDVSSESFSPVRGKSELDCIRMLRALLGALSSEEVRVQRDFEQQSNQRIRDQRDFDSNDVVNLRKYQELAAILEQPPTLGALPPDAGALIKAAKEGIAFFTKPPAKCNIPNAKAAGQELEKSQTEMRRVEDELRETSVRLDESQKNLSRLKALLLPVDTSMSRGRSSTCPICGSLMDAAQVDSHLARQKKEIAELEAAAQHSRATQVLLKKEAGVAQQRLDASTKVVKEFDKNKAKRTEWDGYLGRAIALDEDLSAQPDKKLKMKEQKSEQLEKEGRTLNEFRVKDASTITHFSKCFDMIFKEIVRGSVLDSIHARVSLQKRGLTLKVSPSSASTRALKVAAFDFAVLVMSIEGGTNLPGFLIHDSPRTSDVGQAFYDQLFHLARRLEGSATPLFQYIVTTTTTPPQEFRDDEQRWIPLKLYGNPEECRLLKRNY